MEVETYEALFDKSPVLTLYVVSKKVALANRAAAKLFKRLGLDDPEGADFGKLWPRGTKASVGGLTELKRLKPGEYELTLPDGAGLAVEVTSVGSERPARRVVTVEDITERLKTKEAFRESEAEYRTLVETAMEGIVVVDKEENLMFTNLAFANALGYSVNELVGKNLKELTSREEFGKILKQTKIRRKGEKSNYEIIYNHRDGTPVYFSASVVTMFDSKGKYEGALSVFSNLTERKKVEEALRESQQRFATLVEAALEGIGIVDTEENFIYTNTAFAETLGYSVEEIIEMNIAQLVPAEQFDAILAETEKRRRGETSTYEVEFIHRDGSPVYFVVSVSPMFGRDGEYEGAYAVFLDITDRKKAEEALSESHQRFLTVLGSLDAGVYVADMETYEVLFANQKIRKYFGDVVGETCWQVLQTEQTGPCEFCTNDKLLDADGNPTDSYAWEYKNPISGLWCEIRDRAVRWLDGRTVRLEIAIDISERKRTEEALQESEERYRAFTEEAIVGVYIYRGDKFHFVNKEMEAITGYSRDELLKISTDELVNPEDREYLAEREKLRKKGDELPARYSMRIRRKDGEPAVLMVGSRPIQYDSETAYLGNCVDITENVKAQEALKSEKEKAQQYLDIAGVMLVVISADQRVRLINRKGCELLGYKEKEIIGENWFDRFIPANIREDIRGRFELLMAGEKKPEDEFENPVLTKDGKEPVILWHNTVLRDGTGEVSGILSSGEDITERKLAEEALSKSEREKSAILENMSEFVVYMNKNIEVVWANKAVADSLGFKPGDLAGRKCYGIWFGRDRVCDDCHALTVFETGERVKRERKLSDGRIWNITCDPVRDDSGEIVGVVEVSSDITERKRAEAALRDSLTELQKSLRGTVSTISKIVETRDPYTSGHQTRVAKLARSIAEKMSLSENHVELIYVAALVHDIGKISVPQEILSKPTGKLTELEWNIIRTHPEVGCEILKNVDFPWPVTDVVIQHHERLDGSGYPMGLGADDIMLEARILCVADVVEAMSSHRPYRPKLGVEKAIEEIEENKGKLYDAETVNVCVGLLKNNGFKFDETE